MDWSHFLQPGTFAAGLLEAVAVLFGLASVWFMKKESILAFPFGIINVLVYVMIFVSARLYANAAINGYFFLMSIFGWYNWSRRSGEVHAVRIGRCSLPENMLNLLAVLLLFFLIRYLLERYTESTVPGWDAATTAVYMVAQWLLSRKKIENWLLWITADVVMTGLCAWQGLYFTSVQYAVFTVIAVLGFREWKGKLPG